MIKLFAPAMSVRSCTINGIQGNFNSTKCGSAELRK